MEKSGPEPSVPDPQTALRELFPLKIARVIARMNIGGPAVQAALLTSELPEDEFTSILISGLEEEREGNMLDLMSGSRWASVTPRYMPDLGRSVSPLRDLAALAELTRILRKERPDIVHTHTAKAGTLGRIAGLVTGVPVVVHTFHGNVFRGYFSGRVSWLIRTWEKVLARFSSAVIAISPAQYKELLDHGFPKQKLRLVPLGLPLDRFADGAEAGRRRTRSREELGIGADEIVVGYVARLVPVKDPELMVAAVAELRRKLPTASLAVVGDGPMRELTTEAALRAGVPIRLLGWRDDLHELYPAFDVVALSSVNEGLPVTLIEAMAAERPIASTPVGGVPDLFGLVDPVGLATARTPSALADAIADALSAGKAVLALRRTKVIAQYGEARLIRDMSALYEELAAERVEKIRRKRRNGQKRRDASVGD